MGSNPPALATCSDNPTITSLIYSPVLVPQLALYGNGLAGHRTSETDSLHKALTQLLPRLY